MNEILKKILLHMNYDSKKTLSENVEKTMLNEAYPLKVITKGGWNGPATGSKFSIEKYTLKHKDKNYVLIDTKVDNAEITLKYNCGEQSITIQNSPNNQFSGTILDANSLEKELNSKYCTSKKETDGISQKSTNFVSDEAWQTLYDKLRKKFNVKIGNVRTVNQAKTFTIGNFTIHRTGNSFVTLGTKGEENYRVGQIAKDKYKDQELDEFELRVWYVPDTDFMQLWAFLNLQTEPKVTDKPKVDSGKKYSGGGGGTGYRASQTSYGVCRETYVKGCKSETIKKVQGCLGLSADGKMGPNTTNVIKSKLGRVYFTDADVEKLCGGKAKDDGQDLEIPDSGKSQIEQPKQTSDQIEFGGEEF